MPQHQVLAPAPPVLDGEPSKPAGPAAAAAAAGARPAGASAAAPGTTATTAHALHAFDVLCNQLLGGSRAPLGAPGYENATWCVSSAVPPPAAAAGLLTIQLTRRCDASQPQPWGSCSVPMHSCTRSLPMPNAARCL